MNFHFVHRANRSIISVLLAFTLAPFGCSAPNDAKSGRAIDTARVVYAAAAEPLTPDNLREFRFDGGVVRVDAGQMSSQLLGPFILGDTLMEERIPIDAAQAEPALRAIRGVVLRERPRQETLKWLRQCKNLTSVRCLYDIGEEELDALLSLPHLTTLEAVSFENGQLPRLVELGQKVRDLHIVELVAGEAGLAAEQPGSLPFELWSLPRSNEGKWYECESRTLLVPPDVASLRGVPAETTRLDGIRTSGYATDSFLEHLARFRALKRLSFAAQNGGVTSRGLESFLRQHPKLTELYFHGCRLDSDGVKAIVEHRNLKLVVTSATDWPVELRAKLTGTTNRLQVRLVPETVNYDVYRRHVQPPLSADFALIRELASWSEVRSMGGASPRGSFNWEGPRFTNEGVALVLKMPNLERLDISGSMQVTDRALEEFPGTSKLKRLTARQTSISEKRARDLERQFPNLRITLNDN